MKSLILDVNDVSQQVGEAAIHVAEASGTFLETSKNIQSAVEAVSYTHLRAHETLMNLVCRLLLEKKFF